MTIDYELVAETVIKNYPSLLSKLKYSETTPVEIDVDYVNHPPHYADGNFECIDAIKATLTPEEFRGFCKGNAFKYLWRERMKGGDQSLAKALWYIEEELGHHD